MRPRSLLCSFLLSAALLAVSPPRCTAFSLEPSRLVLSGSGRRYGPMLASPCGGIYASARGSSAGAGSARGRQEKAKRGGSGGGGAGGRRREVLKKIWRVFNVDVTTEADPGKDHHGVHDALLDSLKAKLGVEGLDAITENKVKVVRKSFDARRERMGRPSEGPKFSYVVDVDFGDRGAAVKMKVEPGKLEKAHKDEERKIIVPGRGKGDFVEGVSGTVAVIGCGPAGLFAALRLAEAGIKVVMLERGQAVEERGRDIGAMIHRRILQRDSNICYGEGGAGTWSDGKLTTRIGKNSAPVRHVLESLVKFGAPDEILVLGKPHLGTDRLVIILKTMRKYLEDLGVHFMFGCRVEDVVVRKGKVASLKYRRVKAHGEQGMAESAGPEEEMAVERVIMSSGHSARELYEALAMKEEGAVALTQKGFAVGFRVEHPQALINALRLGEQFAKEAEGGRGKVPVADYRLATEIPYPRPPGDVLRQVMGGGWEGGGGGDEMPRATREGVRPVYSFCMCPGGQVVCTSVEPDELCVNGMSFSRRHSKWANSALVASVEPTDPFLSEYMDEALRAPFGHAGLGGLAFQRAMEREACHRGGGGLVAPVQRVTDFLDGIASKEAGDFPTSSYRLGVKPSALHDLYPESLTSAIRQSLFEFDKRLPGFITPSALLHGVETRTSSPVRISRDSVSLQCLGIEGLYPCGEGAGYAGGIVSAAVDGDRVASVVLDAIASAA